MNDKTKQALELASEELQFFHIAGLARLQTLEAITTIREAMNAPLAQERSSVEQPAPATELRKQQEPVAVYVGETWCGSVVRLYEDLPLETPLYASQPASKPWVGLADEDKQIAFDDTQEGGGFWEFADAIEAKLREKNA